MLKNKFQNRDAAVCCRLQSHSYQKAFQPLLVLIGVTLLIGSTAATAQGQQVVPPWAEDDSEQTTYGYPVLVDVLWNDYGGTDPIDSSTVTIVIQPTNGSVDVDETYGEVSYDPDPGFSGTDYFTYTVADTEGRESNEAIVAIDVQNAPPEIYEFESYPGYGNAWTFEGYVHDEEPEGLTITFGALLDGRSTTTDQDGYFSYTVVVTGAGLVTAQTTDELGEESEVAETYVENF